MLYIVNHLEDYNYFIICTSNKWWYL